MLRYFSGIVLVATVVGSFKAPALRSRFGMGCAIDEDCFKTIPRTSDEALKMGWVSPPETIKDPVMQTFCEPGNPRACVLIDNMGSVCGYQISMLKEVESQHQVRMNYTSMGFKDLTLFNTPVLANQIFFVEQSVIQNGGRKFDNSTGTGLWLQTGASLTHIPDKESNMPGTTVFKKQECFQGMGSHWFYNNTKDLTQEDYMPWFILYDATEGSEGDMVGFGCITFGKKVDPSTDSWFENVTAPIIKTIAPSTPDWIFEYLEEYGIFSHHVYFGEQPWAIGCPKKQ